MLLPILSLIGTLASAIVLLVLVAVVIGIIFVLGRMLAGLVVNVILGLISIFAVNVLFGLGIGVTLITIILVAIFGVPAVLVIVILKFFGIALP